MLPVRCNRRTPSWAAVYFSITASQLAAVPPLCTLPWQSMSPQRTPIPAQLQAFLSVEMGKVPVWLRAVVGIGEKKRLWPWKHSIFAK